ncbi:MAG: DUF802 domain-containing protein [Pseudoxanthomonas sp.]
MSRNLLHSAIFLLGLLAVCWVGIGYLGANPLGAGVALVIGACYVAGALELYRYRQANDTLARAVAEVSSAPQDIASWLAGLPAGLRNPVRLRIEGERVALPAPALTPYLVGLLVLLGMLGTLLGMMATLRGTGLALESATDLQAMRGALAAPVKGLAFAFGTSIAGVACSAMLGLLATLCRRERSQIVQHLDAETATTLRPHSQTHQREQAFMLLRQQTDAMPLLVERLQAMTTALEQQNRDVNEHLLLRQEAFHQRAEVAYVQLGSALEQSMKAGVAESAQAMNAALQPLVTATLSGLADHARSLHDALGQGVQRHLEGASAALEHTANNAAQTWQAAVAEQRNSNQDTTRALGETLARFSDTFEQRTGQLLDTGAAQLATAAAAVAAASEQAAQTWQAVATEQRSSNQDTTRALGDTLAHFSDTFEQRTTQLLDTGAAQLATAAVAVAAASDQAAQGWTAASAEQQAHHQRMNAALGDTLGQFTTAFEAHTTALLEGSAARLDANTDKIAAAWKAALAQQASTHDTLVAGSAQALTDAAANVAQHAAGLVSAVDRSHAELQATLAAQDAQRLTAWTDALDGTGERLAQQWAQTGAQTAERQQQICDALAKTADQIAAQGQAHASDTLSEISRLVQTASEAPRAAAEVIAELRQKLSDSMVRDTALLEERTQLLGTLETLLGAVNHASTEQRSAIDALVATSADLLERVGDRFTDHVQAETGKLGAVADQVTVGAVEVASLGDALGTAVQQFGQTSEALLTRLASVEHVLDKSLARSDEQLAYYVAQAKEVIDLSMLAQRQIVDDLQQIGAQRSHSGAGAA